MRRWIFLLAGLIATSALAQTTAQKEQKQALAQKQLSETRAQIKLLAAEQNKLASQREQTLQSLRDIDNHVSDSQRALRKTQTQITQQKLELDTLQEKQRTLEHSLAQQRAELASFVRSAYALGKHEQLKLLLEQERMSDLARVLVYHRYFQKDRQQRITTLTTQIQALAQVTQQIEAQQKTLATAREQQQQELTALAAQRQARGKTVAALNARYQDRATRLSALGRDEKNTVALLERLRKLMAQLPKPASSPAPGSTRVPRTLNNAAIPIGSLNLPITGTVLAGYGGVMPDGHRSQGLLIAGAAGAEVHAVTAGRVAYADWLKGYGLLMILDHGNGWMTLYAFNDALLKKTGELVRIGEAISTVGSSGGQGRSALYFELRHNGHPQDPRSWLKK